MDMPGPYTLAFTVREGRLERDVAPDAPVKSLRVVDPSTRELHFGDGRVLPFAAISAVAVVYTEKMVPKVIDRGITPTLVPAMRFSIVLVPVDVRADVRAMLEGLVRGEPPPGRSTRVAAAMVDEVSILAMSPSGGASARREAKAIAQVAGLPVFELYGDEPVFRPADALQLSLVETLRARGPAPDPGPPPPGVAAQEVDGRLVLTLGARPSRRLPYALTGLAMIALGVVLIAFADPRPGLFCVVPGVIVFVVAVRTPPPRATSLAIDDVAIEWTGEASSDRMALAELERIRVADDGTLVLVGQRDEVRCPIGEPAAWIRARLERRIAPRPGSYR